MSLDIGVPGCEDAVEIGRGGFGVVYRAWQPAFSRTVAVKVLAADRLDEVSRSRFEREVRAMGRTSGHPHIVTVHQAGHTAGGNPYILMAYEEGGSLAARLAGPVAWPDAVAGGIAVAGALETAHRAGVLHRDVKPENILISRYGEPKLADFGLARPLLPAEVGRARTVTASVLHAAPEILRGDAATVASDVYALASTISAWLRGTDPPEPVRAVLDRALSSDPEVRQQSAARFAEDLQQVQRGSGRPVTELILGDADAAGWADDGPSASSRPGLSLSARRRAALDLSVTVAHLPRPSRPGVRALGAALGVTAALAVGGSRPLPPPVPVALTAAVDFGNQEWSVETRERPVTVRNRGSRTVQVAGVTLRGGDFGIATDGCTGRSLAPGGGCQVLVVFTPRVPGPKRAELNLTLAGPDQLRPVALTGTGLHSYASKDDPPPGPCYADAYQVGQSAYGYVGGFKAISVKQFWSPGCRASMAYVWVWKQYRDTAGATGTWAVDLAVGNRKGSRAQGQPLELWTEPLPVASGCTSATATLTGTGVPAPMTATTADHCP